MEIKIWCGFHLWDPSISSKRIKGQVNEKFEFTYFNEMEGRTETLDFSRLIEEDVKILSSLINEEDKKDVYFHDRIYVMHVDIIGEFIRITYGFTDKDQVILRMSMGQLYDEDLPWLRRGSRNGKIKLFPSTRRTKPQIYW